MCSSNQWKTQDNAQISLMTVIVGNIPANFAACKVWVWVILHTPGMVSGKISWSCGFQMSVLSSLRTQKNLNFPPLSFDWRRALSDEYLQTSADKTKAVCTDTYLKEKVEKYAFWYLGWTLFILLGWYKKDTVCCSASFLPHSPPTSHSRWRQTAACFFLFVFYSITLSSHF